MTVHRTKPARIHIVEDPKRQHAEVQSQPTNPRLKHSMKTREKHADESYKTKNSKITPMFYTKPKPQKDHTMERQKWKHHQR